MLNFRVYLATLLVACIASAQTDLFDSIGSDSTGGSPPPGILAAFPVEINIIGLAQNPAVLRIQFPDFSMITVHRKDFVPIDGFGGNGAPLPDSTPGDLTFQWRGSVDDGRYVGLAVYEGILSGLIFGNGTSYTIGQQYDGEDHLIAVDLSVLPDDLLPEGAFSDSGTLSIEPPPKLELALSSVHINPPKNGLSDVDDVRILYLYTEQARLDAGDIIGTPGIDDRAIRAMIYGTMVDIAEVMENSEVDTTFSLAATALIQGFEPDGDPGFDLDVLRLNPAVQALRDSVEADIVAVVIRNVTSPNVIVCGWSYVQRPGCADPNEPPIPGCNPGPSFAPWAIHFSAVDCLRSKLVGVHELGHNLGCEHDDVFAVPPEAAVYPFAFGYYYFSTIDEDTFNTVMAVFPGAAYKTPYISNPNVIHPIHNRPVGSETANNARTILLTTPAVAGFRGASSERIFFGDFESGALSEWSEVIPGTNAVSLTY